MKQAMQGEKYISSKRKPIFSGSLGPCIGVGIIFEDISFLVHLESRVDELVTMLQHIRKKHDLSKALHVVVAGGCLHFYHEENNKETNALTERTKNEVIDLLQEFQAPKPKIISCIPNQSHNIIINPITQEFEVEKEQDPLEGERYNDEY